MDPLNYSRRFPKAPDHILKFALMNFKIWNLAHFHRLFCLSEIPIYLPLLMKIPFFFKTLSFVHISLTTSWARTTVDLKGTFLGGGLHKEKASRESPEGAYVHISGVHNVKGESADFENDKFKRNRNEIAIRRQSQGSGQNGWGQWIELTSGKVTRSS